MPNDSHEIARQIRQQFFVFRNGLLADNLRNSGDCHKMIFGLNLPQIIDIAKHFEKNAIVATELWNSKDTRECRIIAPMLYPIELFNEEIALKWISEIENHEIADNLCHKLLRNIPSASQLCAKLVNGSDMERYVCLRLAVNLLSINKSVETDKILFLANNELKNNCIHNISVAKSFIELAYDLE